MQASTFVSGTDDKSLRVVHTPPSKALPTRKGREESAKEAPANAKKTSAPQAPIDQGSEEEDLKTEIEPRDPLNWFGIFVPPALKASQTSFRTAVIDDVAELTSLDREMREIEIEIRRTRKKLRKAG